MSTTDCLANTGSGDMIVFAVLAGLLLIGGVVGIAVGRKRTRLAALAVMPLLLGAILLGGGAPSAQALVLDDACGGPVSQGQSPLLPPATTPVPEPTCTPVSYDSIAPEVGDWSGTTSPVEGLDGLVQSWDAADAGAVQTLVDATTMYPLPGLLTLTIVDYSTDSDEPPVEHTVTVVRGVSPDEYVEWVTLSTVDHSVFVPTAVIDSAVAEQLPDIDDSWYLSSLGVVVNSNYLDGCGNVEQATITLGGALQLS
jgi:LPXTG-motif cell wall-anchored protein